VQIQWEIEGIHPLHRHIADFCSCEIPPTASIFNVIFMFFFVSFWYSKTKLVITGYRDREWRGIEGQEGTDAMEGGIIPHQ